MSLQSFLLYLNSAQCFSAYREMIKSEMFIRTDHSEQNISSRKSLNYAITHGKVSTVLKNNTK